MDRLLILLEDTPIVVIILCALICSVIISCVVYRIFKNPFEYPYFVYEFDVTSKRNVKIEDYIDSFLCQEHNWELVRFHQSEIKKWKDEKTNYLRNCKLKKLRTQQYLKVQDDPNAYQFRLIRGQTRYKQVNYIKTSYKATVTDSELAVSWRWLIERYQLLEDIGFEATLNEYNNKNQRKLMTPALRKQIMKRDNYTCCNCGKYMPDEIGLHIDHIIPIAKGGKSVPSNLRVLCSKCNGRKGAK